MSKKINKRYFLNLLYLIILVGIVIVVISQLPTFKGSIHLIAKSKFNDEILALIFVLATFVFAALTYKFLSLKRLKFSTTVMVQFAIATINRVLPTGVGGLATNFIYLTKSGLAKEKAGAVIAINNSLGVIANLLILGILLIFVRHNPLKISRISNQDIIIVLSLAVVAVLTLILFRNWRRKLYHLAKGIIKDIGAYQHHFRRVSLALVYQGCLCLCNVLALFFSLHAVHANLSLSSVMMAFSFSIWLSSIVPTPGGIGPIEAGLSGAFVAFGLKFETAISAVLVFRIISLWIPFFIGWPFVIWSRRKEYI